MSCLPLLVAISETRKFNDVGERRLPTLGTEAETVVERRERERKEQRRRREEDSRKSQDNKSGKRKESWGTHSFNYLSSLFASINNILFVRSLCMYTFCLVGYTL